MRKEEKKPAKDVEISMLKPFFISASIKRPAPPMTGIAKRNENFAAFFESRPSNKAQLMVIPLLEIPGMIATA